MIHEMCKVLFTDGSTIRIYDIHTIYAYLLVKKI